MSKSKSEFRSDTERKRHRLKGHQLPLQRGHMNRLYTVRESLPTEERVILAVNGLAPCELVWCHGIRSTAHGQYGRISKTYESRPGFHSPQPAVIENMPMRFFEPLRL